MPAIAVIGAQWGDEGKGKIVDLLAADSDLVVRFSGGDNAGHTVVNKFGEFKLHLIPSGIFSDKTTCIIGNGAVVNPKVLLGEMEDLNHRNVDTSRLYISDRANLVMPYHILLDRLEEERRGGKAIGTTLKGIGPAFTDKTARLGIRAGDLLDNKAFRERLSSLLVYKNLLLTRVYETKPLSEEEIYNEYRQYGQRLAPHIRETTAMVEEALTQKKTVLLEGAQGTLLDTDFGTYPYATSSSPLAGGACLGAGIGPTKINQVLGVFKAYCSRVGGGPMPTEMNDDTGILIRERAHEYGATTGRPRRCGWFDAVGGRFSTRVNGLTRAAITRLDVLDILPSIKICVGYRLDGETINYFPASIGALERCQPIYEELPGWLTDTGGAKKFAQLPLKARRYVNRLEELIACPISLISVGTRREETIRKIPVL